MSEKTTQLNIFATCGSESTVINRSVPDHPYVHKLYIATVDAAIVELEKKLLSETVDKAGDEAFAALKSLATD